MKTIWLVNPYGPIEGEEWRNYRYNQFGKYLSKNGYKVIWWTANFAHHFKAYRSKGWKDIEVNKNYIIRLVPCTSYKSNFGVGRIIKDILFAKNAYSKFIVSDSPDIILTADNPLSLDYPTFKYSRINDIPVIYDQMDLWPEFIVNKFGKYLRPWINTLFWPVYRQRRKNYKQLAGIIALGKNYLEKAKDIEPLLRLKPSALIYNGIDVKSFRDNLKNEINIKELLKEKSENEIWCIFAGTLGPSYDVDTIIQCAKRLSSDNNSNIKFIIAGSGPLEETVNKASHELYNLYYIGKLLPENLVPIYGKCDIGLATYGAYSNVDMPDKFYDYTAAGLAVINSLQGEISEFIRTNNVGINYKAGSADSFYESLIKISSKKHLPILKKNSFELAMKFDENVQNQKLLEVINNVLMHSR
jgi:glycosyltransferase involved in cell wall biosynthesis